MSLFSWLEKHAKEKVQENETWSSIKMSNPSATYPLIQNEHSADLYWLQWDIQFLFFLQNE